MNNNKGFRLSTFILALSFGGILVVSALFGVSSYLSAQRMIDYEVRQSFDYRYQIVQLNLNEKLAQVAARLSLLSDLLPLTQAMAQNKTHEMEVILFDAMQSEEMRELDVLILSDVQGNIVADASSLLSPLNVLKEQIYKKALGDFEKWSLVELSDAEKTTALVYSVPVVEPELGQVVGLVHAAITLSNNVRFAKSFMMAADVSQIYLSARNRILTKASRGNLAGHLNDEQIMALIDDSERDVVKIGEYVGASKKIQIGVNGGVELNVFTFMKRDRAVGLVSDYRIGAFLLIFGALITALCITYMVRRLMQHSTLRLTAYADRVNKGERDARFQPGPVTEFNRLGEMVGAMVSTLHESERYLINLIDLASSPIIAWDEKGRVTKFNKAAERLMGVTCDPKDFRNIQDVMDTIDESDGTNGSLSVLERALNGSVIENWEITYRNFETGRVNYISWSISPVAFHRDGSVATVLAQGLDVTQRKRAEEDLQRINEELERRVSARTQALEEEINERRNIEIELRNSEERFRDIAEATSDWFWEMGPDLRFTYMSDKALKVSGFLQEEVIGRTREELLSLSDSGQQYLYQQKKWRDHQATLERHEPFRAFEYTISNKLREKRVFRISGKPFFHPVSGEFLGYRGSGRDVTGDYWRAQELEIAKEEAENANQAKTEFLSAMSHELRTPLNGILGFAQLLMMPKENNLRENQKEFIRQILKAGNHLLNLINEILDLAKIEARKVEVSLEPVNPVNVMDDVGDLLERLAEERGITLINEISEDDGIIIYADFTRLKQVLVNLGGNAIKYNHENGEVRFTCSYLADKEMVEFNVIDNGPGIAPDKRADIFLPFNRLNAEFSEIEGTGIGLAITHKLVELMGGEMDVDSEPGKGSRFWFRLPVYTEDETGDRVTLSTFIGDDAVNPVLKRKIHILYVEDNPSNSALMRDTLSQSPNISLTILRTAEEGLAFIEKHQIDLLFLDINLPQMDGWDMMDIMQSKKQFGQFPIIAVTAQAMKADQERAGKAGFTDYLSKPINLNEIFRLIRKHTSPD
jgi:PAS domain S-box-containing protein